MMKDSQLMQRNVIKRSKIGLISIVLLTIASGIVYNGILNNNEMILWKTKNPVHYRRYYRSLKKNKSNKGRGGNSEGIKLGKKKKRNIIKKIREEHGLSKSGRDKKSLSRIIDRSGRTQKKHLIWCLSYPFGGSEEVIRLVELATQKTQASNYGDEVFTLDGVKYLSVFESQKIQYNNSLLKNGPFVNNAALDASSTRVLVRTHCGGTCLFEPNAMCGDELYYDSLQNYTTFVDYCTKGRAKGRQALTRRYSKYTVHDALVIFRHPLEIIAARFKNYVDTYGDYDYDAEGLLKFCNDVDLTHGRHYKGLRKRNDATKVFFDDGKTIPCYTELYRIMKWYGNAIDVAREKRNFNVMTWSYFANPQTKERAGMELLDFLDLSKMKPNRAFVFDDDPPLLSFDDTVKDDMTSFIKAIAPESVKALITQPIELPWKKIAGKLTYVAVSGTGSTIWGCDSNRPNSRDNLYFKTTGEIGHGWTVAPRKRRFMQIGLDGAGQNLWLINKSHVVYNRKNDRSPLKKMGSMSYISVADDGVAYGLFHRHNGYYVFDVAKNRFFRKTGPRLRSIDVSGDGKHIWATDKDYKVHYIDGATGQWRSIEGSMKQLSVTTDGSLIVGTDRYDNVFYRKGVEGSWIPIKAVHRLVKISGNGKKMWAITPNRDIYFTNFPEV